MVSANPNHGDPLRRIAEARALTDEQLSGLFAVSTATLALWQTSGVPSAQRKAVADVLATVELLERRLKPGQLPIVATRSTEPGGRTLLELLAEDPAATRAIYEAAFDFSSSV